MTVKEAREIIAGMEVSADTMLAADKLLESYADNDELPDEVINEVLKIVDKDFDPAKLVEEEIVN
ncbi:MAG: hypothetical protein WAV41_03365 [Microgenomates group bacterium]